jgi:tRNA-2-methylthio-N6-dimethylallyladenosine synthase
MDDVLEEVRHLARLGVREIEFLGQTVNAYRDARGRTLGDLLRATAEVDDIERIRFTTSHPAQMTAALIAAMADARPKLCPYLHLPVQSGSDDVLKAMRRGYDRAGYLDKIAALRAAIPGLALGTDVIVGFPTESESDFESTLALLAQVDFDGVYSFVYSPRPGTSALDLGDGVSPAVKMARLQRLQAFQKTVQERRNRAWVGRSVEVLVEGADQTGSLRTGRTPESRIVNFEGTAETGSLAEVKITASTAYSLKGKTVRAIA